MSATANPLLERQAFDELAERHRREIQLHCYRMLGSIHDAEDALQDVLLNAWRARAGYEGRASFRTWLYRIATNTCLRMLERRAMARRFLPAGRALPGRFEPLGDPDRETPWLEPYPDSLLSDINESPGPEALYEAREAIRLAFVAAIHELPPRQRAVLLLRDVVGLTAEETAASLEMSRTAVNSALQRARSTMARGDPARSAARPTDLDDRQRELLERYVRTWEAADVDGFVGLLAHDAVWSMPPWIEWYRGRDAIGAFLAWVWRRRGGRQERLMPTMANGSPAFAYYRSTPDRD
jgi:RNA polymerase sigma-70 factor (ECF subfamily)